MQPGRGTEIDGDAEWDVVKIADQCTWHENFNGTTDWICANEESDCYGAVTSWDDCCIDYEPKHGE